MARFSWVYRVFYWGLYGICKQEGEGTLGDLGDGSGMDSGGVFTAGAGLETGGDGVGIGGGVTVRGLFLGWMWVVVLGMVLVDGMSEFAFTGSTIVFEEFPIEGLESCLIMKSLLSKFLILCSSAFVKIGSCKLKSIDL